MADVCIVFILHHADRLRPARALENAASHTDCIDEAATKESLRAAASVSFLPALKLLREVVDRTDGAVRFGLCPTGPFLRNVELHHGALLRSLHKLNATGAVEWICAPRDWSILSIYPGEHFTHELEVHAATIQRLFGVHPTTAANTELIYDNSVARRAAAAGMKLVLCGCADAQLAGRTANRVYRAAADAQIKVLARHVALSDDWGLRFSDPAWTCFPLKPETYAAWIADGLATSGGSVCPIMLHLADLGITHPKESGIFSFNRRLLGLLVRRGLNLVTPREAADRAGALSNLDMLDVPQATSGWGPAFDLAPWLGNAMQSNALHLLRKALGGLPAEVSPATRELEAAHMNDLLGLCAVDHLQAMRHAGSSGRGERTAEERRRPAGRDSAYDAYIDYTTALRCAMQRLRDAE